MGQARDRLKCLQAEQPHCIYCGGAALGTSIDHMPPMTVFDLRQRYGDMVYLACEPCHTGTRPLDQFAGFLCRSYPNPRTPEAHAESKKIVQSIANNFPHLLPTMRATAEQLALAKDSDASAGALNISTEAHSIMVRFAARVAFALHFELCRAVIPEGGGVFVRWFTNEALVTNDVRLIEIASLVGPSRTLVQGRKSLADQFEYRSQATEDGSMSLHVAAFRLSFGIEAYAARDVRDLAPPRPMPTHNRLFRPGFLR
jgi:hypothetical protein